MDGLCRKKAGESLVSSCSLCASSRDHQGPSSGWFPFDDEKIHGQEEGQSSPWQGTHPPSPSDIHEQAVEKGIAISS